MGPLICISLGPGDRAHLTDGARAAMTAAPCIFAYRRYLPLAGEKGRELPPRLDDGLPLIARALEQGPVAVLLTGDGTAFSLLGRLKEAFPQTDIQVVPGIGSRNALFAALALPQDRPVELSGHGRPLTAERWVGTVACNHQTLLYCDRQRDPAWALEALVSSGFGHLTVAVGSDLTWPQQFLACDRADRLDVTGCSSHALVLACNPEPRRRFWPGLPDSAFVRGKVPMTKQAIRAAIVAALAPAEDSVCWDLGAGTGSVAVELALAAPCGSVWAVERDPGGQELIATNAAALGAYNLRLCSGTIGAWLERLPRPDRVFIGGSGGELELALAHLASLGPGIAVALSSVTLETSARGGELLKAYGYTKLQARTLAVTDWRLLGSVTLAQAQNPVTLWTGETGGGA